MKNLVSAEWLKNNTDKENLVILDVRYVLGDGGYGKKEYEKGHIPNAVFIPLEEILTGEIKEHGGRHPLPNMEEFTCNMNNIGVDDKSTAVIYDDGDLSMAGRLWWMLRYIGHGESYVLSGGYKGWESKNYPVSTNDPEIRKADKLTLNLQKNMIADINAAKKAVLAEDKVLVDSRTGDRYRGEIEPIDRIPGHIPGAVNLPWTDLSEYNSNTDITEIKKHFKSVEDYNKIIVHCGSGITGTVNILFMEEAELSPELYVGGYSDWISYPENEVATEI
mgnify:CR=1 FL=1